MPDCITTDINILRQISKKTTREEIEKLNLKKRIIELIPSAWIKGYGLAAIQIGIQLRYAYFTFLGKEFELINPKLICGFSENIHKDEGCLSIPKTFIDKKRYFEIEYMNDGKKKKAKGLLACIIQHEIDHMNGILITDIRE